MSSNAAKLTSVEALCFLLIGTINRIVLNTPQKILMSCASASMLNVIYISIIIIIFVLIILKLYKHFTNYDIIDISEFVGGKVLKTIIGIALVSYFVLITSTSIRNFAEILHVIYYTRTTIAYVIMFFVIACAVSNLISEQAVLRTNVAATFIMLISLFITFISIAPNIVYQRALPILGHGAYSTFFSGLSNIFVFNGLIAIFFLGPMLADNKNFNKLIIFSTIIISILLFLSTASLLLSLPFNSNTEYISPIYTLISNNRFGNYIQHPEALFVFSWILSIISYVNIVVMLSVRFLNKVTNMNNTKLFVIPICILIFIIALIPTSINDTHSAETFLYQYIIFPMFFTVLPIILIIANIKYKRKHANDIKVEKDARKSVS